MKTTICAKEKDNFLENIAKNAIMDADIKTLCDYAKQLARQLNAEQVRMMINHYQRKEPIDERV